MVNGLTVKIAVKFRLAELIVSSFVWNDDAKVSGSDSDTQRRPSTWIPDWAGTAPSLHAKHLTIILIARILGQTDQHGVRP
jgi:hypothetical protein